MEEGSRGEGELTTLARNKETISFQSGTINS